MQSIRSQGGIWKQLDGAKMKQGQNLRLSDYWGGLVLDEMKIQVDC